MPRGGAQSCQGHAGIVFRCARDVCPPSAGTRHGGAGRVEHQARPFQLSSAVCIGPTTADKCAEPFDCVPSRRDVRTEGGRHDIQVADRARAGKVDTRHLPPPAIGRCHARRRYRIRHTAATPSRRLSRDTGEDVSAGASTLTTHAQPDPLTIRRAREERLAQVAGSLTFTTVLSIVPLLAVSLHCSRDFRCSAVRAGDRRAPVEEPAAGRHLAHGPEVPEPVRRERERPDLLGSLFVLATAVAMLLTVENALNQIWRVKRGRPLLKRVGLYL